MFQYKNNNLKLIETILKENSNTKQLKKTFFGQYIIISISYIKILTVIVKSDKTCMREREREIDRDLQIIFRS